MNTKTALTRTTGRVRFWKTATSVFGLASAGVFAYVALCNQGLDTALYIAAIPAVFAGLSAVALRSVVSPYSAHKFPIRIFSAFAGRTMPYDDDDNNELLNSYGGDGWLIPLDDYELSAGNFDEEDRSVLVNPATGLTIWGASDASGNTYGCGSFDE